MVVKHAARLCYLASRPCVCSTVRPVNLHMLAQLTLPDFPHQPTHTQTQPESCCPSITPWGAPWRFYGGPVTRVMSVTYVPFSRSLGLGSRKRAPLVWWDAECRLSQSTCTLFTCSQEMQPCRTDVGCISPKGKHVSSKYVHAEAGSQTALFFSFSPAVIIFFSLLITSIRGRAFICSRLFYSLLAHGLETSIGQRG